MNLWGGDKAIITGNVSNPRLHSTASAEKTFTQLVEQNLTIPALAVLYAGYRMPTSMTIQHDRKGYVQTVNLR
ncbi:hypothetical protein AAES_132727 [Amazona aestiva]|uniref:Uncharacterized protein n=1 Tax=Amazona aestiva TaxID=12930 RepID=A0A0Q3M245_AMAAE|nr:hypothetical protein AAES_132727 [Amazona aestiva]